MTLPQWVALLAAAGLAIWIGHTMGARTGGWPWPLRLVLFAFVVIVMGVLANYVFPDDMW